MSLEKDTSRKPEMKADKFTPKCLDCARLEYRVTHYRCPRNAILHPKKLPAHFAEKCALFMPGMPEAGMQRLFHSSRFDVEVAENHSSICVTAKNGYSLKVCPESTPQKIIIRVEYEEEEEYAFSEAV